MFDYNSWANRRILDRAEAVTSEQWSEPSTHSYSSLHATLVHLLDTEYGWRLLLQSGVFSADVKPEDFPTVAALRARWAEEEAAWRVYLGSLRDFDLRGVVRYEVEGGIIRQRVIWHCLYHVVNHGMQHRSEAAELLTRYGSRPATSTSPSISTGWRVRREEVWGCAD
jgi:uncharacterized damage-inducible protein DinB